MKRSNRCSRAGGSPLPACGRAIAYGQSTETITPRASWFETPRKSAAPHHEGLKPGTRPHPEEHRLSDASRGMGNRTPYRRASEPNAIALPLAGRGRIAKSDAFAIAKGDPISLPVGTGRGGAPTVLLQRKLISSHR